MSYILSGGGSNSTKHINTPLNNYKREIEQILKDKKLDYTEEMLNFIAAVGLKESSGGESTIANYIEPLINTITLGEKAKSLGEFQINPETFKDYLPEDYDWSKRADQVHAVYNFVKSQPATYQYKGKTFNRGARALYSQYNTGKPNKTSRPIRKFQQIYEDLSKFK